MVSSLSNSICWTQVTPTAAAAEGRSGNIGNSEIRSDGVGMQRVALTMSREVECLLGTLKVEAQVEWSESPRAPNGGDPGKPYDSVHTTWRDRYSARPICDLALPALRRSTSRILRWVISLEACPAPGWKKRGHADSRVTQLGPSQPSTLSPPVAIRCGQVSTTSLAPQQAASGLSLLGSMRASGRWCRRGWQTCRETA
jgi:hypothetical protein